MGTEDRRVAVGISITLSGQLIAAALAMLAIEGAFVSYAVANREVSPGFVPVAILAAVCFIASIFVAGKAITRSRNSGHAGIWDLAAGGNLYDWQAKLSLAGLVAFFTTVVLMGTPKERQLVRQVNVLQEQIDSLIEEHRLLRARIDLDSGLVATLSADVESLLVELRR